jgi:hypothetical protein
LSFRQQHIDDNSTIEQNNNENNKEQCSVPKLNGNLLEQQQQQASTQRKEKIRTVRKTEATIIQQHPSALSIPPNFAPVRVFQCSSCHQQGTYKWVVERHIRAKHPDQSDAHVIELPAELAVKLQKITPPLKRFRCSLCPLQSKHTWVIIRVKILYLVLICSFEKRILIHSFVFLLLLLFFSLAYQTFSYITNSIGIRHTTG